MKKLFWCLLIVSLSLIFTYAHAADILVKWGQLAGEVELADYVGYSYATEISMGISNDCSPIPPLDPNCPKFFDGLVVTKFASSLGVHLARRCAAGTVIQEIIIASVTPVGAQRTIPNWKLRLNNAVITKVASAIDATTGFLMEAIEILPQKIEWTFYNYSAKGTFEGYTCAEWDRENNFVNECSVP